MLSVSDWVLGLLGVVKVFGDQPSETSSPLLDWREEQALVSHSVTDVGGHRGVPSLVLGHHLIGL